jgi:hypothetical protein
MNTSLSALTSPWSDMGSFPATVNVYYNKYLGYMDLNGTGSATSSGMTIYSVTAVAAVIVIVLYALFSKKRKYPPGPRPLPIVGNMFDVDAKQSSLTYMNWKTYGLYYIALFFSLCYSNFIFLRSDLDMCSNEWLKLLIIN